MVLIIALSTLSIGLLLLLLREKKRFSRVYLENQLLNQKLEEKQNVEKLVEQTQNQLKESFSALSSNVLEKNSKQFLDLAKLSFEKAKVESKVDLTSLIDPMKQTLKNFDEKVGKMEQDRVQYFQGIKEQMASMIEMEKSLKSETAILAKALHSPSTRGRWGEIQLKKVVEMSGMLEHCDFTQQTTITTDEKTIRPDLIVNLPGEKVILVDSKAPLNSYLLAIETNSETEKKSYLKKHAGDVKARIIELSKKSYWDQVKNSPEFVVLFLPGEMFFSAALQEDPSLIEYGVDNGVLITTPTTLIALLRSVAYGWRQESISKHAAKIFDLGKELYKRLSDLGGHWSKLGKDLQRATQAYNQATGTLESRVLPQARRFEELGLSGEVLPHLEPLDSTTRLMQSQELKSQSDAEASSLD